MSKASATKREWDIKYLFAKQFGWTPDVVDLLPIREVNELIKRYNREVREQNRQIRLMKRKNGRRK